mmetsp:Transcript_99190/g.175907  ORF Transcript_99190/g.175907 Transcript_99190/m.175907 type:complete len:968 (+) Transcript_99190:131-3034(+)
MIKCCCRKKRELHAGPKTALTLNDGANFSGATTTVGVSPQHAGALRRYQSSILQIEEIPPMWKRVYYVIRWMFKWCCKQVCDSKVFASITTLLTIYALFGDDLRLIFTQKPDDIWFDRVTIVAMSLFALEIIAFCGGKPEYMFGFFFWLDILSTITLVMDVTTVGEKLFGDSISKAGEEQEAGGGGGGAGDSAEAARAARMSRAGTKAGRVVRLIRLLRLMKMLKVFKKDDKNQYQYPGDDWDDDDEDSKVQESAVSKKLSEMTTRRVIILVLTIMLSLPFFKPDMFANNLDSAGQFGVDVIYRKWADGIEKYKPLDSDAAAASYLASDDRAVYVDVLLSFIYKHNPRVENVPDGRSSPNDNFNKIFWMGGIPQNAPVGQFFLPNSATYDWNSRWNGENWEFYAGNLPADAQDALRTPWSEAEVCVRDMYRGVSLLNTAQDKLDCPDKLRFQERSIVFPQWLTNAEAERFSCMFVFDRRAGSRMEALLNTLQTLFICLLLGVGSMTFSNDANKLVLAPIERMISKLDRIRNNPLEALKIGEEQHRKEQVIAARGTSDGDDAEKKLPKWKRCLRAICPCMARCFGLHVKIEVPEPMETQILETTIIKIGSLLALGFGEAGAQIIGQNMKDNDSTAVMGMIPGRKVEAVYAYCDIRNFADATEILQDQVMIFVNRIAGIVHSCVDEFFGSPNQNVGDAFLLVWRLSGHTEIKQHRLADMSLISMMKIIAKVNVSPQLAEYRTHPKLVKRFPNYRTRIGFGLHLGWAIEGAIGSEFKIDASYVSPNVNMATRLEDQTRLYSVPILLTDALCEFLSEPLREECRLIDSVKLHGGKPFKLYTMDVDELALEVEPQHEPSSKGAKFKARWERQRQKAERWSEEFSMHKMFVTDRHIKTMRYKFTEEFMHRFKWAYLNYESGNWVPAKKALEACRFMLSTEDGPSAALLRFIKSNGGVAGRTWPGYRLIYEAPS